MVLYRHIPFCLFTYNSVKLVLYIGTIILEYNWKSGIWWNIQCLQTPSNTIQLLHWHPINHTYPSPLVHTWLQYVPSTKCNAVTCLGYSAGTSQISKLSHQEGQGQRVHEFPSTFQIILTLKHIAALSLSLGSNPESFCTTALWECLHQKDCSALRQLTTTFQRAIRDGE